MVLTSTIKSPRSTAYRPMRTVISEACANIREIFRAPNSFTKSLWTAIFLASVALCIGNSWSLLQEFIGGKIITSYTRVNRPSLPFPQVTVCTYSRFVFHKFKNFCKLCCASNITPAPNRSPNIKRFRI